MTQTALGTIYRSGGREWFAGLIAAAPELFAMLKSALHLIETRGHYIAPEPDNERPEWRTIAGCAGEEWRFRPDLDSTLKSIEVKFLFSPVNPRCRIPVNAKDLANLIPGVAFRIAAEFHHFRSVHAFFSASTSALAAVTVDSHRARALAAVANNYLTFLHSHLHQMM